MKKIIHTAQAPNPIGPYSQAVIANNMLYASGQIAIDPANGELLMSDIATETHQVMKNIGALLKEAGLDYGHIVKTSIFLKDMGQFAAVNEVYGSYFKGDYPARETVQVAALPRNVNVEISITAILG
jgi:2-iminobutanoate/2-iminopropanoate deaminase